jgi:hypothetical protein
MAYFNQNNDGAYKAYYKPKAPPGGTSSIFLGGDDKPAAAKPEAKQELKPEVQVEAKPEAQVEAKPEAQVEAKPEVQQNASQGDAQKENSRPGTGDSEKSVEKNVTTNTKLDPILPKTNDIFAKAEYGNAQPKSQSNKSRPGVRVINPPGGKSSGPLW